MDSVKIDVIIPTFHPKARFLALMEQLEKQVLAVNRIVIVNTEKKAFEALMDCDTFLKEHPKAMLFHISQDEFEEPCCFQFGCGSICLHDAGCASGGCISDAGAV